MPRRFFLVRHHDVTGISGDGVVAHGIQWIDGTATLRWGTYPSTAVWDSIDAMLDVHGHVGSTTIQWLDPSARTKAGETPDLGRVPSQVKTSNTDRRG